jgi:hypothetical protein
LLKQNKDDSPPEPPRNFNPEEHTAEKREWTKRQQQQHAISASQTSSQDQTAGTTPTSTAAATSTTAHPPPRMYEHFCIVGLPPTLDVKAVSADIKTARRASAAGVGTTSTDVLDIVPDTSDSGTKKQYGIKGPVLSTQIQILTTYPTSPQLPEDLATNIAAFCFPHGVRPELLERTPSMSGLNEVVFGRPYQTQSDHSFVFRMSVADPGDPTPRPLYGICCYAKELVHRPPALARDTFPQSNESLARYMVTAPRCYCLLTRYPFFDLHFRVLHTVLGLERLDRMSTFAGEVALGLVVTGGNNSVMRYTSVTDSTSSNRNNTTGVNGTGRSSIGEEQEERRPENFENNDDQEEDSSSEEEEEEGRVELGPDTSSSTGFATPMHASTEERELGGEEEEDEVEGILVERKKTSGGGHGGTSSKKRLAQFSRGLSEGTECEGLLSPDASTSSIGSDVASTPRSTAHIMMTTVPPSTPFYTPAPNSAAILNGRDGSRRLTKYHGAPSPGAEEPPLLLGTEEDAGNAIHRGDGGVNQQGEGDLLGRMESVKQLLDASLIELDTRLRPSPPVLPLLGQSQTNNEESVDLVSSSLELGNWVGATDSQGQPILEDADEDPINGLNYSLAALLTLTPPSTAVDVGAAEHTTTETLPVTDNTTNNKLDALDVLYQYLNTAVPPPGESVGFQPDPVLHPIVYHRPASIPTLEDLGLRLDAPALPDIDAASNLSAWTISALCQSLSLESILTFFSAVLLERQVVLFCPNVGVLCGVALSLVPLLLPFSWQSLLLPVLPATASRLDLLEAPVPFVVGVLFKTQEVRARCGGLVRVNIYKNRVKNANSLPALPNAATLAEALAGPHALLQRLGKEREAGARPVHVVSEAQIVAAQSFSSTLQRYLQRLVADLKGYTITDVSEGSGEQQRVSVLLKDSFLDSFPPRDRVFMRQFAETQMFAVYCDSVLG